MTEPAGEPTYVHPMLEGSTPFGTSDTSSDAEMAALGGIETGPSGALARMAFAGQLASNSDLRQIAIDRYRARTPMFKRQLAGFSRESMGISGSSSSRVTRSGFSRMIRSIIDVEIPNIRDVADFETPWSTMRMEAAVA